MENNNADYWEERWKKGQTAWDIGYASPPIIEYFKNYANKTVSILIPGCGNAYEAEVLYKLGYKNITLVDISKTACDLAVSRLKSFPGIKILNSDFFILSDSYNFIIEQTFFCALLPDQRKDYVAKMNDLLHPKGHLIGLLFDREFAENPPYGGNKDQYAELFENHFNILTLEKCYNSIPQRLGTELFMDLQVK